MPKQTGRRIPTPKRTEPSTRTPTPTPTVPSRPTPKRTEPSTRPPRPKVLRSMARPTELPTKVPAMSSHPGKLRTRSPRPRAGQTSVCACKILPDLVSVTPTAMGTDLARAFRHSLESPVDLLRDQPPTRDAKRRQARTQRNAVNAAGTMERQSDRVK